METTWQSLISMTLSSGFDGRHYFQGVGHTIDTTLRAHIADHGVIVSSHRPSNHMKFVCQSLRGLNDFAFNLGVSLGAVGFRSFAMMAACIGVLLVDAEAAITFKDPFRGVSAGNNKGLVQAKESGASGVFNESAQVGWEEYWSYRNSYYGGTYPNTTGQYFTTATQESIIGLSGVVCRGSVLGTGSFNFYGLNPLRQNSQSYFRINVLLDNPGNVHLSGFIRLETDPWGLNLDRPEIEITFGGNGLNYSKKVTPKNYMELYEHEINEKFTSLPSGEYEFAVSLKTVGVYMTYENSYDESTGDFWITPGSGGYGNAMYEITLVPEPSSMLLAALGGALLLTKRNR